MLVKSSRPDSHNAPSGSNPAIHWIASAISRTQQFRRAVLNVLIRNQDDHVKNIAFLMNRRGEWRLSPAFDVSYAYNLGGNWTHQHQMSLNGKRDHFEMDDLVAFGAFCSMTPKTARAIVADIHQRVGDWMRYADQAGVPESAAAKLQRGMRREIVA